MAKTGLFLIIFLVVHLIGNITLLFEDGEAFNQYAHFMKHNKLIVASEVILFLGFLAHIVQGIALVMQNKAARKQGYAVPHKNEKVSWTSKMMGPLGVVILVFLILHLWDFFAFKYGIRTGLELVSYDGVTMENLFGRVINEFKNEISHAIFYPLAMIVVGLHLSHGFQSAFQTFGLNHKKYTPIIKCLGLAYSIVVPLLFALIPIMIYLGITIG